MKNRFRRVILLLMVVAILSTFAACTSSNKATSFDPEKAAKKLTISSVDDLKIAINKRCNITVDDIFENFESVTIDGKELTKDDFYVSSTPISEGGYIQITLLEDFLLNLGLGEHKIQVVTKAYRRHHREGGQIQER